jgi:nonribosomal peptide synthetase MxcG
MAERPESVAMKSSSADYLGLSAAQEGIFRGQQLDPASPSYGTAECIEIAGEVDTERLVRAIRAAVLEADTLHARFVMVGGSPRQHLAARVADVRRVDLPAGVDALGEVEQRTRLELAQPFDLSRGPLHRQTIYRSADGLQTFWVQAAHHIALDGFGCAMLARRVAELYSADTRGAGVPGRTFGSLASVVDEDLAYRASAEWQRDRAFWLARMQDTPAPATLSEARPFARGDALRDAFDLEQTTLERLRLLGKSAGASWADALVAALVTLVHRESGASEVVLGLPMMCRLGSVALRVPCMAMNIVPLRLALSPDASAGALTAQVAAEVRALRVHGRYRYEQLRRDLGLVGGGRRLFGPVVNIMPFADELRFGDARSIVRNISAGPVEDLSMAVRASADGKRAHLEIDAHPEAYTQNTLARHRAALSELLEQFTDSTRVSRERARAFVRGEPLTRTAADVIMRILGAAHEAPEAVALEQGATRLRYGELIERARLLAAALRERGIGEQCLVGVALPRSPDAVVSMLAILLLGAAYLPLDPDGPPERLAHIVRTASPRCVIAQRRSAHAYGGGTTVVVLEDLTLSQPLAPVKQVSAETLAYVIFTSGSTGVPNGVEVERGSLAHFVAAAEQRYGLGERPRILQFAPLFFDASVEEIFLALCSGGTLVLRGDDLPSVPELLRTAAEHAVDVLDLPTALFHELAHYLAAQPRALPSSVRTVIIGGEAVLRERALQFVRAVGGSVQLFNTYGPTECTVVATTALLTESALRESEEVAIGAPLPGIDAAVLSTSGALARSGEVGELCLLGPTVARGYLGKPRNQQRFAPLTVGAAARRAYRTGDLVRLDDDSSLRFVGRVDDEIKISGQRIDPREVEDVLVRHPGVREAFVLARSLAQGTKRLSAYVVLDTPAPSLDELKRHARAHLLAAAVPADVVALAALPRSGSGKIDRTKLLAMAPAQATQVADASDLEQVVLRVFREVLGVQDVTVSDDFFQRGGESLQTIQVANRLTIELAREVPVALLFRHPSVRELAAALEGEVGAAHASFPALISDAQLPAELVPSADAPSGRSILLTGATGFVGAHLLQQLLTRSDAPIVCLVRADDADHARERLAHALSTQGLTGVSLARVESLACDLASPRLGLSDDVYARLTRELGSIYHCAANVSLTRGYASVRRENVSATLELVKLACAVQPKALHYVSTLAVAPPAHDAPTVPEQLFDAHRGLRDGYTQSKWVSEQLVAEAHARGLPGAIYRLARVVGALDSGFVNRDDIVFRLLRAGIPRGLVPALPVREIWTPVDYVARTIVSLAARAQTGGVYHVAAAPPIALNDLFGWARGAGYRIESGSLADFRARLLASADADADALATLAFIDLQEATPGEPLGIGEVQCDRVRAVLAAEGECPAVGPREFRRYLDFCVRSGLLPPPHYESKTA